MASYMRTKLRWGLSRIHVLVHTDDSRDEPATDDTIIRGNLEKHVESLRTHDLS